MRRQQSFLNLFHRGGGEYWGREQYVPSLSLSTHIHAHIKTDNQQPGLSPVALCPVSKWGWLPRTCLIYPKAENNCYFVPLRKGGPSLSQWLSNFSMYQNHLDCCLTPGVSVSIDQRWACYSAFLTSSQAVLMLLVLGSHFENHWPRPSF